MNINMYNLSRELSREIYPQVKRLKLVGSIRRKVKNPGDIDFVIVQSEGKEIVLKDSIKKNWDGRFKTQHELSNGIKVDFLFTTEESFGAAVIHFTGSQWFNIRTRSYAKSKGLKLNEYGLFNSTGEKIASKSERKIFESLRLEYKNPRDRK